MSHEPGLDLFLSATPFIECGAPAIVALVGRQRRDAPIETAVALFDWVRDNIKYDPTCVMDDDEQYAATATLARRRGYCIQKAVLLAALCRAAAIPTRLGFADVRNHKISAQMERVMGTNLFVFHGFVELHLGGRWVKATPTFDEETSRKNGVLPVELDGMNDAMFHPVDPEGHPFIEYVKNRGTFADLPIKEIRKTLESTYPAILDIGEK